jgi:hypothetical protein
MKIPRPSNAETSNLLLPPSHTRSSSQFFQSPSRLDNSLNFLQRESESLRDVIPTLIKQSLFFAEKWGSLNWITLARILMDKVGMKKNWNLELFFLGCSQRFEHNYLFI